MPLFLSNNKAILFLHIPKCGGTSVGEMFISNGYSCQFQMRGLPAQPSLTTSPQHQTCSALKSLIDFRNLSETFTLTRNPYQRLASEFNWSFRDIALKDRPDFNEWVIHSLSLASQDPLYADSHFRPAIDFIDLSVPTKVFRLEDGLRLIAEYFFGRPQFNAEISIKHSNNSCSMPNSAQNLRLNHKALAAVNKYYYYDFLSLGYRMNEGGCRLYECDQFNSVLNGSLLEKSKVVSKWRLDTLINMERIILTRLMLSIGFVSKDLYACNCLKERLRSLLKNKSK